MDNNKLDDFLNQIKKVIPLIEKEYNESSKPMLVLILRRYKSAKEIIENVQPENLNPDMFKIHGGVRAFLDASSNYMNPILDELDKAEELLDNLFE